MSEFLPPHKLQHAWIPCPLLFPWVCLYWCPLSPWCHPTISASVTPFSSCLLSSPASGPFTMSWLFASGGQSFGASASVLPMSIQGWFSLGLTGLISLLSNGLSRVLSSTTIQKHQFSGAQPFLKSKKQRHYIANKGLSSQGYGFSSGHVWMWELHCEESWAPKNWCFWTVVLEKTLESPLDCKEIQPVHPKGDQSWVFTGRTDAEAETPILWPPHAKSWLVGKDPDKGRDWG